MIAALVFCVTLAFLLKIGFYSRKGRIAVAVIGTLPAIFASLWCTELSVTSVDSFFASRSQMQNLSICVTLEAHIMMAYCFDCIAFYDIRRSWWQQTLSRLAFLYPGLLVACVPAYLLTSLLFTYPGINFQSLPWWTALATFFVIGLGSELLLLLFPKKVQRLETLFLLSLANVIISVIITGSIDSLI